MMSPLPGTHSMYPSITFHSAGWPFRVTQPERSFPLNSRFAPLGGGLGAASFLSSAPCDEPDEDKPATAARMRIGSARRNPCRNCMIDTLQGVIGGDGNCR